MKKSLWIVIAIMGVVLAGCGSGTADTDPTKAPEGKAVTPPGVETSGGGAKLEGPK
ncbi:MAG: hypothetical protein HONBIEJF_02783 [Fimbriimonadaceae bacterium]|nr:hypothetical protein [Fimbriimonadaceae bacterium]